MAAPPSPRKHVVSVSLGSSSRDARIETEILGIPLRLERRGVDGSLERAAALIEELDGRVDAFGLGGIDLYVMAGGRRYEVRDAARLAAHARRTPVVCGAGLKDTLERLVVERLDAQLHWAGRRVLLLSAVDRFGMAEALAERGAEVTYGDLIFLLGVPWPLRSLRGVAAVARVAGPLVTRLPFTWLYPTGAKQEDREAGWRERFFREAEVIAGDFLLVKRYAPEDLDGKIVLTNTTTADDVAMLRRRGVRLLITTTPRYDGRSLATNLLEAAFVALAGKHPLQAADYRRLLAESGLEPDVQRLQAD